MPTYLSDIAQVAEAHDTRVATHNVEPAKVRDSVVHQLGRLRHIADIGLQRDGVGAERADLGDDFQRRGLRVRVVDDDFGAAAGQLDGHGGADAAAGAGDERDFTIEAVGEVGGGGGGHDGRTLWEWMWEQNVMDDDTVAGMVRTPIYPPDRVPETRSGSTELRGRASPVGARRYCHGRCFGILAAASGLLSQVPLWRFACTALHCTAGSVGTSFGCAMQHVVSRCGRRKKI